MTWTRPSYIEINMSAEIGAYQADGGGNEPPAPSAVPDQDQAEPTVSS
jgi:coenzyme PQQ precursor peptide PqqA